MAAKTASATAERVLPHNLDAERAVLGAVLVDNAAFDVTATVLAGNEFFRDAHQRIYEAMLALRDKGSRIDLLLLKEELERTGNLEAIGGPVYISELLDGVPRATNVQYYAEIVREKARLRAAIYAGSKFVASAYAEEMVASLLIEAHVAAVMKTVEAARGGLVTEAEAIARYVKMLDDGTAEPVPTGLTDLDNLVGGFKRKDLVVVAARPSVGKTSLAVGIGRDMARRGMRGIAFSLEMGTESLASRLLAWKSGVPSQRLERKEATAEDYELVAAAMAAEPVPLLIETTSRTVTELAAWCRRALQDGPLDFVVVDYLQLLLPEQRHESEEAAVKWISRALKNLAKELNVVMIVLSQLSRAPEGRRDNRPKMSDLRGSGAIEQDCDLGVLMFREEMHKPKPENAGVAELIVAKNRNGPTGVVRVGFHKELAKFANLAAGF